jgi:N-acetylglucosamine kinase-like BadF-type ATPase
LGFVIGLDGGRSKTAGLLCDDAGRVLARARGPGSAILGQPSAEACQALAGLVGELCTQAAIPLHALDAVGLGLSGVDFADEIAGQHAALAAALGVSPPALILANDAIVALWAAAPTERLSLIQHGTELTSALRTRFGDERVFDSLDIGAVYDLRREAFVRTARMLDGRAARSGLADRMLAHCAVAEADFAAWAYRSPQAADKRLQAGKVVFEAWRDGDPAAAAMVDAAAGDYAVLTRAMGARLGPGAFAAAFGGGLIAEGGAAFTALIRAALARTCPDAELAAIALAPEAGGALMAAHRLGWDAARLFEALRGGAAVAPPRP